MKTWRRAAAAVAGFVLMAGGALSGCAAENDLIVCDMDAITNRNLVDLAEFAAWVDAHQVQAVIGEAAWPGPASGEGAAEWNALADRWLAEAKAHELPVYAWAAAPWWSPTDPSSFYRGEDGEPHVTVAEPQAELFESHLAGGLAGGVNLAEATFDAPINEPGSYANGNPGTIGEAYTYPSLATLTFLADRGITETRFAVMWERVQPRPHQPLDPTELSRLRQVYRDAERAGIKLVLDVHNFGRYADGNAESRTVLRLGDPGLPGSALVDLWTRIAQELGSEPASSGYDLMNEPHDLPGGAREWERISRNVALAIRQVDTRNPIWVGGYNWSGVQTWAQEHPRPWMPKDAEPVIYQAHQYFDHDYSGSYRGSYAEESAAVAAEGSPCPR